MARRPQGAVAISSAVVDAKWVWQGDRFVRRKQYYVYIVTNKWNRVLYTGVTNDLMRRMEEHRFELVPGFTARYRAHKLIYYEAYDDPATAIAREKQIKGGSRQSKVALILQFNRTWRDLREELLPGQAAVPLA